MKRFPLITVVGPLVFLFLLPSMAQQINPSAPDKAQPGKAVQSPEAVDANDPLFGVPPLPKGKVSLIGGTVQK
ncbi:MAG: hypothetical protein ACXVZM_09390, partial [Terriglobales bacterium]